jgi:hypothetical protein
VNIDANEILASVMLGLLGMALLVYAKRQARVPHGVVGVLLMVYPYFVPNVFITLGIGVALVGGLWAVTRYLGW